MEYIFWASLIVLFAYLSRRLNWGRANIVRQEFFRGAVGTTAMILVLAALLLSVCNFLMCFADEPEYHVVPVNNPLIETDVMDSIHTTHEEN